MGQAGRLDDEVGRKEVLPALFNAAGLIVPEPAIMSVPMPFADVETGCEVEYMAGRSTRTARRGSARRGRWRRRRERRARVKSLGRCVFNDATGNGSNGLEETTAAAGWVACSQTDRKGQHGRNREA